MLKNLQQEFFLYCFVSRFLGYNYYNYYKLRMLRLTQLPKISTFLSKLTYLVWKKINQKILFTSLFLSRSMLQIYLAMRTLKNQMRSINKIIKNLYNEEYINFDFKGCSYREELQTISARITTFERDRSGI